jgi:hypothetical protein
MHFRVRREVSLALWLVGCVLPFCSPAPAQPQLDIPARMAGQQPFDGSGRYKLTADDGVRSVQGLFTLAQRYGPKPYDLLGDGQGKWDSERVIFRDVDTGALMMRLTDDPFTDALSYFQGNWTADGRSIVFRRRPGMWESSTPTHGPMAMNADGSDLRNVFRDYHIVEQLICSPTQPDECYSMPNRKQVVAFSVSTGKEERVLHDIGGNPWWLKVSLDGKYLINRGKSTANGPNGLWIVSTDGKEYHSFAVPLAIHDSYRIDPVRKKVMFWYEGKFRTEGFVECNFDGSQPQKINVQFDWNHGDMGWDRGVHSGGYITMIQPNGWGPIINLFGAPTTHGDEGMVYDDPVEANGYTSWWPKDRMWSYNTRMPDSKSFVSEIDEWSLQPAPDQYVNRYRVCSTAIGHGKLLDCPNASPDGTKVLFNSNMLGNNSIYCVVARLPEQPLQVQARSGTDGTTIGWQPAHHHAETAGYNVYRSKISGTDFQRVNAKPIAGLQFVDAGAKNGQGYVYAVTAVEHSGLESGLSNEVSVGTIADHHFYIDADSAKLNTDLWVDFQGDAADLHYIWMRKKGGHGVASFTIDPPAMRGAVTLWARIKGGEGASFAASAGGQAINLSCEPTTAWKWVKASPPLEIKGQQLQLTSDKYGSAVDQLVLTDDGGFAPADAVRIRWPQLEPVKNVDAQSASPYVARVKWDPASAPVDHYNVYCGATADFTADQTNIVRSPATNSIVDWGLKPGQTVYYRVVAVDSAGNMSAPSSAVKVQMPAIAQPFLIEKDFAPSIALDLPADGTYAVWLHIDGANARGGDYITVQVDNEPKGPEWVSDGDGTSKTYWLCYDHWGRFDLKRGTHTLTIDNKTTRRIDKVTITNDLSYRPHDDHVTSLYGW